MNMKNFDIRINPGILPNTPEKQLLSQKEIFLDFDKKKWEEKIYSPYQKTLLLFITNQCNLDCLNCFYRSSIGRIKDEMEFEYIKQIIENNPTIEKYDIMGGEPLLHSEFDKIISFLEKKEKKIGLYTNGFLLHRLKPTYKNLKINIAFHSIDSNNPSSKPIAKLEKQIKKFQYIYPIKLVFLMNQSNKHLLLDFTTYIENTFEKITKLTIGTLRNETDYYDDTAPEIVPLEEYAKITQDFINSYTGKLDIDIFGEGMLITNQLPKSQKNQINRFRGIFKNNEYSTCLYDIGANKRKKFNPKKTILFKECKKCPLTKKTRCLTDKIKLKNIGFLT